MIVVLGATGNVGKKVAERLIESGRDVRVIGRDSNRLKEFAEKGAETVAGQPDDSAFLTRIFEGAEAIFAVTPFDVHAQDSARFQDLVGEATASALASARVPFVVNLSSLGAEHESGTGPIASLHRQEKRLNQLKDVRLLHLRPTYFMENFFSNIPLIKNMGINGTSIRPDVDFPMIGTVDVAVAASTALTNLDFPERQVRLLLGPRNYTMLEATRILGAAIGKPDLPYVQFSPEELKQGLLAAGISPSVADSLIELESALNSGLITRYERNHESTTPTTLEEFAAIFAAAYARA